MVEDKELFSYQPSLVGDTLSVRPLYEDDFDALFTCASDKKIWAGHPNSDRYQKPVFEKWFDTAINSKATVVVIDNNRNEIIGSSRFYWLDTIPDDISIGFTFLACQYWGGPTNFELKTLMLNYAFNFFDTVWFHIAPSNIRSQKATQKIGCQFSHEEMLKISTKDELWYCYKMEKKSWQTIISDKNNS